MIGVLATMSRSLDISLTMCSQASMFQAVYEKYGRLDALCANAGIVDKSSIFIFEHRGSDKIPPST
jgi:NAD(P)-dependent dehydrogenase (short-subunit alcohol dehydrogenase family)